MHFIYDITKSFEENQQFGPFFTGEISPRTFPVPAQWYQFLDYAVASRIGIGACPLTASSRGVALCARLGFDIITYKTIRSITFPAYVSPNIRFIDLPYQLTEQQLSSSVVVTQKPTKLMENLALANSIGNASNVLDLTLTDIAQARSLLFSGQLLLVSIYGEGNTIQECINDFVRLAQSAQDAGAHAVEANFSCPNIISGTENFFSNAENIYAIAHAITHAISIPLLIKTGFIADKLTLQKVLCAAARAGVRGITGINAVRMRVVQENGEPVFFGKQREYAGVSGAPIRQLALRFLHAAISINAQEKLGLTFIGLGGIVLPEHFDEFFSAGVAVAQTVSGAIADPYLAMKYHMNSKKS